MNMLIAAVRAVLCPRSGCGTRVALPYSAGAEARVTCGGCGTTFLSGDATPLDGGWTR